ncbi:putative Methyltransferase domain-containing protein [Seiridium cardinale]|uniref:Methyltransferase domain-containing protein n=1 Tax=Seiridium cardinale TaxID=138064 RepID=A0ABR2XM32_9PEZI
MQEQQAHDRKPSAASAESAKAASAVSAKSRESGSSQSSGSNRKRSGFTIPDPVSVEEHGRTFNGYREGKYLLPNDAVEQERLDLAHEMWRLLLFGDLSWVPFLDEPKQVLDIGTGTGIWAIEFAQQHPASHVIGTDISLIQPPEGSIPSNCVFERDDIEEEWVFDRLFDYVHLRAMLTCFNDHVGVLKKIYDNLRPGGWAEYHDYDPEVFGKDEANQQALLVAPVWDWSQRVFKGAKRFGRDMMIARRYKQLLIDTGFVDVTERIVLAPNKPWPEDPRERRIGQYMQANSLEMIGSVSAKLFQADGMSLEEVDDLVARCRECFQSKELHLYSRMYVVYGRRPREDELPPKTQTQDAATAKTAAPSESAPRETPQDGKPAGREASPSESSPQTTTGVDVQPTPKVTLPVVTAETTGPAERDTSKETVTAARAVPDPAPLESIDAESKTSPEQTAHAEQPTSASTPMTNVPLVAPEVDPEGLSKEPPQGIASVSGTGDAVRTEPMETSRVEDAIIEPVQETGTIQESQPGLESREAQPLDHATNEYDEELKDLAEVERKTDGLTLSSETQVDLDDQNPQQGAGESKKEEFTSTTDTIFQPEPTSESRPELKEEPASETVSSGHTHGITNDPSNDSVANTK